MELTEELKSRILACAKKNAPKQQECVKALVGGKSFLLPRRLIGTGNPNAATNLLTRLYDELKGTGIAVGQSRLSLHIRYELITADY